MYVYVCTFTHVYLFIPAVCLYVVKAIWYVSVNVGYWMSMSNAHVVCPCGSNCNLHVCMCMYVHVHTCISIHSFSFLHVGFLSFGLIFCVICKEISDLYNFCDISQGNICFALRSVTTFEWEFRSLADFPQGTVFLVLRLCAILKENLFV